MIVTQGDLAMGRAAFADALLENPCTVIGEESGEPIQTPLGYELPETKRPYKCLVSDLKSPREIIQGDNVLGIADTVVLLPFDATVASGDLIDVPGSGSFRVLAVEAGRTFNFLCEANCRRVA